MKRILLIIMVALMMVSCATTNQTSSNIKILDDKEQIVMDSLRKDKLTKDFIAKYDSINNSDTTDIDKVRMMAHHFHLVNEKIYIRQLVLDLENKYKSTLSENLLSIYYEEKNNISHKESIIRRYAIEEHRKALIRAKIRQRNLESGIRYYRY